ncbi:MAG: multiprotein bridging factor aMBF1 [Nanobdellota archaeon]
MQCDMCGIDAELYKVEIEGTILNVCRNCSKYGKTISSPAKRTASAWKKKKKPIEKPQEEIDVLVEDFSSIVKKKREDMGLKQKELAAKMAERESVIQKIESGHFKPSLSLAKKFEKLFGARLIDKVSNESKEMKKGSSSSLTIGDVIKFK